MIATWRAQTAGARGLRMQDLVRSGRWQRLGTGVYAAFSDQPPRAAILWGALLRSGPRALLSHQSAAELDGLLDKPATLIHVTVPAPQHRQLVPGVVVHRSTRSIGYKEQRGLPPRTNTEETALDLAGTAVSFDDVIALIARACQQRLTTPRRRPPILKRLV